MVGRLGDRVGRKKALAISVLAMSMSTFSLGLLPTYSTVGPLAPVLLATVRVIQGLSVGGQLPACALYILENSPPGKLGLFSALPLMTANLGTMSGGWAGAAISGMSEQSLLRYGWRIPFLSGIALLPISYVLHFKVPSPHTAPDDTPFQQAVSSQLRKILTSSMVCVTWSSSFYVIFVWLPTYLSAILDPPYSSGGGTNAMVMSTTLPLFFLAAGAASDVTGGRRKVILAGW